MRSTSTRSQETDGQFVIVGNRIVRSPRPRLSPLDLCVFASLRENAPSADAARQARPKARVTDLPTTVRCTKETA
ncbi:hypothetical protein AKJ09_03258 [Labilithrix luteola]|uniref:Uncharacterized protein n=1 Tax=Labilithrix luteola TaxID=1391654 RepID=A0A0K1PTY5_9BACT|nr:hypothetical protein AKJ09_03258 [Labilithrix luteola]